MTKEELFDLADRLGCEIPSGPEERKFFFYSDELFTLYHIVVDDVRAECIRTMYDATSMMHEEQDMILKDIIASAIKEQA